MLIYVLDNLEYEVTPKGSMCNSIHSEIKTVAECQRAAIKLGLQWGSAWNGTNDFPSCLLAQDGKVYFNLSPNPGRTNVYPKYSAICRIKEGMKLNVYQ